MLSTAMDQEIESFRCDKLAGVFLTAPMHVSLERNNEEKILTPLLVLPEQTQGAGALAVLERGFGR